MIRESESFMRSILPCALLLIISALSLADPATEPSDPSIDSILADAHPTTTPSDAATNDTGPSTQPAAVLSPADDLDDESRDGVVTLSDGSTLKGKLSTTLDQ